MKSDDFVEPKSSLELVTEFESIFVRLLEGEKIDLCETDMSSLFEIIATHLMADVPGREWHWYDGVVGLEARIRKARQVDFTGEMWVMSLEKGKSPGKENFRATVTDKRATKQGIWIVLQIGEDRAEGELADALKRLSAMQNTEGGEARPPRPFVE